MRNNLYSRMSSPIFAIGLLLFTVLGYAQTNTYPTGTVTTSASGVTNSANAGGNDLTNAARISSSLLSNNNYVQVNFTSAVSANTPVYIKVNAETTLLQGLLGGAIGGLVTDLAALLVDGQNITVQALNGSTSVNSATITASFNNDTGSTVKIIQNAAGDTYIRFIPSGSFNNIRITNTRLGLVGTLTSRWLDVYGAFYTTGYPSCTLAQYTSYTGGGLVSADITAGAGNANGYRAIDNSASTFSTLSIGTAGVAAYAEQQFYYEGSASASDTYFASFSINPQLISAGLLNNITFIGYNGNNSVYTVAAASLLSVDLLGLLQSGGKASVAISPNAAITKLGIRITGLANANLAQQISIYSVTKGGFSVALTGGGNYLVGQTATLTATPTGCSTYTYSWSGGLGSTATVTAPTTTPGTYTYTVTVTDAFGISVMATTTVTVLQPPVAGTVNGAALTCYGTLPGNLTLTGYTGNILRWEKSTDAGFTSPVTLANTTATLTGVEIGAVTQTTYVRAVVTQNGYPNVYATGTITVKTTTWNGTAWSSGAPDINTMIFFTGNYSENANVSGCAIQVNNNAVVVIPTDKTVTLQYNISVNSGSLTFNSNAHLIQQTGTANVGNVTMIRKSMPLFRLDYTLWSAPVAGMQLKAFSPNTLNDRFYEYKYDFSASMNQYFEGYFHVDPLTTYFTPGKAFLIRMPNSGSASGYNNGTTQIVFDGYFTGVPNNGTYTTPLFTAGDRFTGIGNPYPSPINVQAFFDANQTVLQNGSALYFWRKKNNSNATSYATMTRDTYVSNPATGGNAGENQYGGEVWDNFFNNQVAPANWVINPGQGFLVQTSSALGSANATFTNSMRRDVHNNQFFRTGNAEVTDQYAIDITGETDSSRIAIVHSATATTGMDIFRDATLLEVENTLNFYSLAQDKHLVVQALPNDLNNQTIALGYKAAAANQYSVSVTHPKGTFANGTPVYLTDTYEGITRNIAEQPYTFTTDAGTFNNRFQITYTNTALGNDVINEVQNSVVIYKKSDVVSIDAGNLQINNVKVYDLSGRTIHTQHNVNATSGKITNLTTGNQVVIVEVNTVKGTVSKKVVF